MRYTECGLSLLGLDLEVMMNTQYDLFEVVPNHFPRWIGAAADLAHAKERLNDLAQSSSERQYFVRDFCSGSVVAHSQKRHLSKPAEA